MIRKNDMVQVIVGKDKGKTGKVLAVFADRGRALVEKLNMVKRHQRPTQKMRQGGLVEKEASLSLANLMPYCAKCGKGSRVRIQVGSEGEKRRVCHRCGESFSG